MWQSNLHFRLPSLSNSSTKSPSPTKMPFYGALSFQLTLGTSSHSKPYNSSLFTIFSLNLPVRPIPLSMLLLLMPSALCRNPTSIWVDPSMPRSCLSQEDDVIIGCALIDMYAKCSSVSAARKVFDTSGFPQQIPHCNAMINGYVYNGLIQEARALFEDMAEKSVVSFTSLMTGYVQNDMLKEALELLAQMYSAEDASRIEGNSYTFVVGLEACTQLTDLNRGKQIHAKIIRRLTSVDLHNPILGTMLIDMYAKSASVRYAQSVFNSMVEKNVFAWTSIITCYALHGDSSHALQLFKEMIDNGVEPNEVTFVSVLSACSHCGLVKEGLGYFKTMTEKYGLVPREDHFTCLIDMLGRVGRLGEAWEILEEVERVKMHQSASTQSILAAMAGACQLHGNVDLGRRIAAKLLKKREQPSSTHIALSNVYASAGLWQEAYQVRETGKRGGDLDLEPGISRIWTSTGNTTW